MIERILLNMALRPIYGDQEVKLRQMPHSYDQD